MVPTDVEAPVAEVEDPLADEDTIFVTSNPDRGPVTRFGIPNGLGKSVFIGAERDPKNPKAILFSEDIVAIPGAEFRAFPREYLGAIRCGDLKQCKREDWESQASSSADAHSDDAPDSDSPASSREG